MHALSPLDLEILQALLTRAMRPKTIAEALSERYHLTDRKALIPLIRGRLERMAFLGLIARSHGWWIRITRTGRGMLQVLN